MTKSQELVTLDCGYYGLKVDKKERKVLCPQFVEGILGAKPPAIEVVISDEPMNKALRIAVLKGGYYRWWWRFYDCDQSFFGMTTFAENALTSFFKDARDDGLEPEHIVWLFIKTLK
jgi:hypothetical protein